MQEYVAPTLTVDAVVFQLIDNQLAVLLIQRAREPFKGQWALPGGYNSAGQTTKQAMGAILQSKAGLSTNDINYVEQLYTFDTIARDPRGHAVSVVYMGLGKDLVPRGSRNTHNPQFFPITDLPDLAYDHQDIIKYAQERLQSKISYTNVVFALLPKLFTLSQLQTAYEAILCQPLDKRNFRKKFLTLNLISPTTENFQQGAHRPARLYKFNKTQLEYLTRSFD